MERAAKAGAAYFAIVFACGFALGAVRVLIVAPRLGAVAGVLIEAPVMLSLSWLACGWCVARFQPPAGLGARLVMAAIAFALLMAAETGVAVIVFGRGLAQTWAAYGTPAGLIGLAAQIGFGLIPLARGR